jgi:hypothetical protein
VPVHCHRTLGYQPRRLFNEIAVSFAVDRELCTETRLSL